MHHLHATSAAELPESLDVQIEGIIGMGQVDERRDARVEKLMQLGVPDAVRRAEARIRILAGHQRGTWNDVGIIDRTGHQ